MKVAVVGTGYVGLVTGTCFSEAGNDVICVDNNQEKLAMLRDGQVPIYEPGLETLFDRNTKEGRLSFTDSLADAVDFAEIIFLALPTPPTEDGSADLKYVLGVANEIGKLITEYKVVVNKSTVPVGTADKVRDAISAVTDVPFDVVSNPEFLREGFAVQDFMKPERIVLGSRSEPAIDAMRRLYKPFVMSGNPIIFMDERSAEVTKYAANSFLATKISFMNEIANLCEKVGADVDQVRRGMGTDSRIGKRFLFPGVGYGGSCFPKDVSALFKTSQEYEYMFKILDSVMNVNEIQKGILVDKVRDFYQTTDLSGKTFGVWGLAFKPNTDDIREAPALVIIKRLLEMGATVKAYDPEAMESVQKYTDLDIEFVDSQYQAVEGVDAMLLITEWNEFRTPDFDRIKSSMKAPVIFDGRNVYELDTMRNLGFVYHSIGRASVADVEKIPSNE
ncbi:UDP-glucose/GDP-mannose dehydrogenase family protein [Pontibacter sp. G13]|uniref:UDP-glucose dehydrogenase family protein n=1 Tax=Pontibacter sp. G13 TaxID=3074898 RepID=UPI00288B8C87|nr:UDP-glucose/GDP-mannose dehydrogenase family protein [Pontibacter sp. G13]WNJ16041.1 UDP-glucose/GDP-mannose dehydrogenase family protein [Pontibacter sp. G13]